VTPLPKGHVVELTPSVDGLPIDGRNLTVELSASGHVVSVRSDLVPFSLAAPATTLGAEQARQVVATRFGLTLIGTPTQVVIVPGPGSGRVAWRVPTAVWPLSAHFNVWVDAENGAILKQAPAGLDQPSLTLQAATPEAPRAPVVAPVADPLPAAPAADEVPASQGATP
jgi:Zn-dependent metalloprotease